jgi:hypothetical protein
MKTSQMVLYYSLLYILVNYHRFLQGVYLNSYLNCSILYRNVALKSYHFYARSLNNKKGLVLILVLAVLAGGSLWAEQPKSPEPLIAPGDLALSFGLGYGFFWGAIDVSGGGAFATLHLGFKDLDLPSGFYYLNNVDTYIGLGAGFFSYTYGWTGYRTTALKIGLRTTGGASYFFTPNFALTTEYGYYGYYSTGLIGVLFKL